MRKKNYNLITFLLILVVLVLIISGCDGNANISEVPYSVGLDSDGYYLNLDKYNLTAPSFEEFVFLEDDVVQYAYQMANINSSTKANSVDEFLKEYANSILSEDGYDLKTLVEESDIVEISMSFKSKDGVEDENYHTDGSYYIASNDSDEIIASLIGHSTEDEYVVEYTFDENDEYHPGETMDVFIKILSVSYADPIGSGVVENNLESIQETYVHPTIQINNSDDFIKRVIPYLMFDNKMGYIEYFLQTLDFEVPKPLVDYEISRLKTRLETIGYTYKQYKEDSNQTDEQITETCTQAARENLICMLLYRQKNESITESQLKDEYGEENYSTHQKLQGEPYMKLRMMRNQIIEELSKTISFVDNSGNVMLFE